jgi:glycine/D-amino acid oxidase-like deaminating enzyme
MDYYSSDSAELLQTSYDFVILGAGLAGMCTAVRLVDTGYRVLIIDTTGLGAGASGTPVGLMNPATAQKANLPTNAQLFTESFYAMIKKVSGYYHKPFILSDSIYRAATDETLLTNFQRSYTKHEWPEGWAEWQNRETLLKLYPNIRALGALKLNIGSALDIQGYLNAMMSYCKTKGAHFVVDNGYRIENKDGYHQLIAHGKSILCGNTIQCFGNSFANDTNLRLHRVKGQTATFEISTDFTLEHAFSSYGYMASDANKNLVVGSTYEHYFSDENPDSNGMTILREKLLRLFELKDLSIVCKSQWSGIRVSTPDRMPFIGTSEANIFVFGGLGSKGLYYSAYLSELLVDFILNGNSIPKAFDFNRNILRT